MIPKVIHYCWFGGNPLPPLTLKCIASWRKFLPEYRIIQWSEGPLDMNGSSVSSVADEIRVFDVNLTSYSETAYKQGKYAFVSDFARFWILYRNGGLYFDTDVEIIHPLGAIIANGNFMGFEVDPDGSNTPGIYAPWYCFGVNPGLGMGLEPQHPFAKRMMVHYGTLSFAGVDESAWRKTVVAYTTEQLCELGLGNLPGIQRVGDITIYPHEFFAPINVVSGRLHVTDNTHTIHRYMGSWEKKHASSLKDMLRNLIPESALIWVNRVKRSQYKVNQAPRLNPATWVIYIPRVAHYLWESMWAFWYKRAMRECGRDVHLSPMSSDIRGVYNLSVGDGTSIPRGSIIYCTEAPLTIGKKVLFGPRPTILTGDHRIDLIGKEIIDVTLSEKLPHNDQPVVIEDGVWVGANVTILKGVTIGRGSVVAAGSVVTRSCAPYSIIGGVPAKLIRMRFTPEQVAEHEAKLLNS